MKARKAELLPLVIAVGLFFLLGMGPVALLSKGQGRPVTEVQLQILEGIDRSYAGRYARDPRFLTMLGTIQNLRDRAFSTASARTGLAFPDQDRFVIRFDDWDHRPGIGASIRPFGAGSGRIQLVTLSSRQFVLGVMDIHASLAHEFIHGVMREMMGGERYEALPKWVREGIAVWGAGQLRERCRNLVASALASRKDSKELLCEVTNASHPVDEYLMDAILFEYISQNHGDGAVRTLLANLMAGADLEVAFELTTGLPWADLIRRKNEFTQMFFEGVLFESGLEIFQDALRRHDDGDVKGAKALLTVLVEGPFDSLLQPDAWYYLGRWRFEEGDYTDAAEAFSFVLDHFPNRIGLLDPSSRWLARSVARMNESNRELVSFTPSGAR